MSDSKPAAETGREPAAAPGTLVLALGNPLRGDDGVGAAVLEQLAASGPLPAGTRLLDGGTPGLESTLLLAGCRRAIILDAADMGCAPGTWRRLAPLAAVLHRHDLSLGLHAAGLAEALALGEALGLLPVDISLYGIQPLSLGWVPGLSQPVRAAVPCVCQAVWEELQAAAHADEDSDHGGNPDH